MNARLTWIADHLARGNAVCPGCLLAHPEAGAAHRQSPWSITPRCTDCGEALRMPEMPPSLAFTRDQRIRDLWPSDLTLTQIGLEIGVSQFTVSRAARRMGLPSRAHRANRSAA